MKLVLSDLIRGRQGNWFAERAKEPAQAIVEHFWFDVAS
jgi:hypothetical protein